MEEKIDMLMDLYPDLEELFEVLDIEIQEVLTILVRGGHVKLPDFIETLDG